MLARSRQKSSPVIPPGRRIYAIGDIHGEGDLLRHALQEIRADSATRRDVNVTLVFLGDLIDRGPDAADLLRTFARMSEEHVVVLKGNHEAALVDAYRGDHDVLREWLPFGAAATLAGFGITSEEIEGPTDVLTEALRARVDPDLIEWLSALPGAWECGDYYFTHAGIRPGVKLHKQAERDLLWIREPFLSSPRWHGKVVVHGHTVEPGLPSLGGNRIGIDTGAHEHGVLTALGLEGGRQWLLQSRTDQPEHDRTTVLSNAESSPTVEVAVSDNHATQNLEALIASIVTPVRPSPDTPLLLKAPTDTALGLSSSPGRAKGLGNGGYVAAGFALVLAVLGGAIAIGPRSSPFETGNVTLAIPVFATESPNAAPAAPAAAAPSTHYLARKTTGARPRASRRSSDPVSTEEAGPAPPAGPSPRLYGAVLERALEEDRVTTRRLNQDELSRQQSRPSSPR